MKLVPFATVVASSLAATAIADPCVNMASNNVLNFGVIGPYVGGDINGNPSINTGQQITCAPLQNAYQANKAIQSAYRSGVPFQIGLASLNYDHGSSGNHAPPQHSSSYQNLHFACGLDTSANVLLLQNLGTNQFTAQACSGGVQHLINLPVFLGGGIPHH